jgi:hypothetical protein
MIGGSPFRMWEFLCSLSSGVDSGYDKPLDELKNKTTSSFGERAPDYTQSRVLLLGFIGDDCRINVDDGGSLDEG